MFNNTKNGALTYCAHKGREGVTNVHSKLAAMVLPGLNTGQLFHERVGNTPKAQQGGLGESGIFGYSHMC